MLQIGWRVVFLLALPVFVISGKDGLELDENTDNSLHREDGLDVSTRMSQLNQNDYKY